MTSCANKEMPCVRGSIRCQCKEELALLAFVWVQTSEGGLGRRRAERRGGQANPPYSQNVKRWKGARVGPVLPERAASEGPRSTGAVGPTRAPLHWIVGQEDNKM